MDRRELFTSLLHALNESFAAWVQQERSDRINEIWIDGAEDYVKHAKKLLEDFADVLNAPAAPAASADANGSIFTPPAATSALLFALPAPAGLAASTASAPQAGGAFGLPPASGGLGLFGMPPASAVPAPFASFSFMSAPGGAGSAPAPAAAAPGGGFGGFGAGFGAPGAQSTLPASGALSNGGGGALSGGGVFGFGAPPAGAFAGFGAPPAQTSLGAAGSGGGRSAGGTGGDAENEEEAPKEFMPEVRVDEAGAAILYKNRAKVYVQGGDKAWKEKGQGLLTVRQPAGEGTRPPQVVFTTESGRVLVNAALYRGVKVVPQAKKPNMATLSLVVAAAEGEEPSMRPVLANLHSADNAAAFVAAVAKAAPK